VTVTGREPALEQPGDFTLEIVRMRRRKIRQEGEDRAAAA
jgi:hypothetical protein